MNTDSDEILSITDVSRYLKIPVSSLYKLIRDGAVPAVKIGKHWRFMKRDVEELFKRKNLLDIG